MGEALMALQEIFPGKPVSTAADIWLHPWFSPSEIGPAYRS
jgi:hypothetical protein